MTGRGLCGQTRQREHHTIGGQKVETEKKIIMKKEHTKLEILALEEEQEVANTQVLMVMKAEELPQAASGVTLGMKTDPQATKDLMMTD